VHPRIETSGHNGKRKDGRNVTADGDRGGLFCGNRVESTSTQASHQPKKSKSIAKGRLKHDT